MNQLTPQQVQQALKLRQEGYSIRDTALELGVAKSQIEWLLLQQNAITLAQAMTGQPPVSDPPTTRQQPATAALSDEQARLETERARLDMENRRLAQWEQQLLRESTPFGISTVEHTKELERLIAQIAQLTDERAEFEQRVSEQQRLLQSMPGQEEAYELFRQRAQKDKMTKRYNALFQELLDNSDDIEWSADDVDEYLEKVETQEEKFDAFCSANQIDKETLLMTQGFAFLIGEINEEKEEQTAGLFQSSSIRFNYSETYQGKIKAFMVERFDQVAPATMPTVEPRPATSATAEEDEDLDDEDDE